MQDDQILEMLKELVEAIDSDIYDAMFLLEDDNEPEPPLEWIESLVNIVKKHLS